MPSIKRILAHFLSSHMFYGNIYVNSLIVIEGFIKRIFIFE